MNIDALYKRVTEAIIEAEALETKGPSGGAAQAYLVIPEARYRLDDEAA